jgi:stage II sporulation protein D
METMARTEYAVRGWLIPLALLAGACSTGGARVGAPGGQAGIRVGVAVGVSSVRIESSGGLRGVGDDGQSVRVAGGAALTATVEGSRLRVVGGGVNQLFGALRVRGEQPVAVNGVRYRGDVELMVRNGSVTAVNVVGLEDYIAGVVGVELGPRPADEMEALKAQAVAARTYALRNRGKWASSGFDLAGSVSDQGYRGVDAETRTILRAVRETAGEVITYQGELIDVFYHSTCGYSTATPQDAFETVQGRPYLQSVSDQVGDRYYCDASPHFRWAVEWSSGELQEILKETLQQVMGIDPADVGLPDALVAYKVGDSGRITELRIVTPGGDIPVTGPRIRQVLRRPEGGNLRSNAVEFSTVAGPDGPRLRATGAGFGHGVGMCQWGAIGRARAGQSYRRILSHYLPGTNVEQKS